MSKLDIVYCRVSTDEQANNTSLDQQEDTCRASVERIFDNPNILVLREDYSGFERDRPELSKAIQLIQDGKVRSFTAMRVDRLCRKVSILEFIRDGFFKPYGVRVFTPNDLGEWSWNPMHESMQEYYAVMASNWGKMAVMVMAEGRKAHLQKGNVITAGNPPFGLTEVVIRNDKGKRISATLEFDPIESKAVLRAFEHLVSDRLSVHKIVTLLNDDKVPTLTQSRGKSPFPISRQSLSGHKWHASTIRQILRSPVYKGIWQYGKKKSIKVNGKIKKVRVTNSENIIEVAITPLIPPDIWQQAQEILDKNRVEKRGRPVLHQFLVSKRIGCECGFRMTAHTVNHTHFYYRCPNGVNKSSDCITGYKKAALVDEIAFNWLYNLLSNKELLKSKIDNYIEELEKVINPLNDRLAITKKLLDKKHEQHDAMITSYMQLPPLAQAKVLAQIEELEAGIIEHKKEYDQLTERIASHQKSLDVIKEYAIPSGPEEEILEVGYIRNGEIITIPTDEPERRKAAYRAMWQDSPPETFEDKLRYVVDFDLQATILHIEGDAFIRLTCKVGSDVLPLLDSTSARAAR